MAKQEKNRIRIELTEEQTQRLREQSGVDASAFEFTAEELEERIAPSDLVVIKSIDKATPTLY